MLLLMFDDPYGRDVLKKDPHKPVSITPKEVRLEAGMVLEDVSTGFVGAVIRTEKSGGGYLVELEDRRGKRRSFPLGQGFWLDGVPIDAKPILPTKSVGRNSEFLSPRGKKLTNSGSVAATKPVAKVAKASRIWVEGRHDAELVQHVWGEDLADAGIAVELLDGADNLEEILAVFGPTDSARAGVLLDHMVPGSKETRIADKVTRIYGNKILVIGHPYVDIWQAVKPARIGLTAWPQIPRGTDIKVGTLRALGWPAESQTDIALGWKKILHQVRNYRDLEAPLLGRVEELIDFVTVVG